MAARIQQPAGASPHQASSRSPEAPDLDHFNPDQSIDERRQIQRGMRNLNKRAQEEREELLNADSNRFAEMLRESDELLRRTKQTSEATIDSRFVLNMAELASRRSAIITAGNIANGVDVDEFVSKCITYMKHGRGISDDAHNELSNTQHQRRIGAGRRSRAAAADDDEEEIGDEGDMLNWAHFGKYACVPFIRRPAVPGLLLGPLSVERKVRKVVKRTAPLRVNALQEVRPEVLDPEAMQGAEKGDLTATCSRIRRLLQEAEASAQESMQKAVEDELPEELQDDADALRPFFDRFHLRNTGGMDLMSFAINPRSFAQTVENIFYISFLIRDGQIALEFDDDGLPSISSIDHDDPEFAESTRATRHQAIISLDEATWKDVIKTFKITKSIIPHREEPLQRPGARGWYS